VLTEVAQPVDDVLFVLPLAHGVSFPRVADLLDAVAGDAVIGPREPADDGSSPRRGSRLRSASALSSAPKSSARPVSQGQASMITAESEPQVLLYEPNLAV
jgi:hypothetical protein